MVTLRRAKERHHLNGRKQNVWVSFYPEKQADPFVKGFGSLALLNEHCLSPGASVLNRPQQNAEIVTYVREGALAYENSLGCSGVIHAGEFQCVTTRRNIRYRERNASPTNGAHVFQIWLRPAQADLEPRNDQKRFFAAERRNVLRVIASPDGRTKSLVVHANALIYSAMLDPGQHLIHELAPQRSAWLHIVCGNAILGDVVLTTGDGAGVAVERAVSLTAEDETEILLFDVCEP